MRSIDCVNLLHCICHKLNLNYGRSYIDKKNKKATINPMDNYDKYFQDAAIVALNHEEIVKKSQRASKNKLFINKFSWKKINYPSKKDDWKRFEKNNSLMLSVAEADAIVDNGQANSSMDQLIYLTKL